MCVPRLSPDTNGTHRDRKETRTQEVREGMETLNTRTEGGTGGRGREDGSEPEEGSQG